MATIGEENRASDQEQGLAALAPFLERLLPAMLRRHLSWRGLADHNRHELLADLRQELRLDCLEHLPLILAMSERERNQRWFRLVERWVYRHRRRGDATAADFEPDEVHPAAMEPTAQSLQQLLPDVPYHVLDQLVRRAELHGNGRCNATATGYQIGLKRNQVRALWAAAASRLGYDDDFLVFWQRRLAEALTGLAADLLLDRDELLLLPRRRRRPDPKGRLRRIRRIHAALTIRPMPFELRRLLSMVLRAGNASLPPTQLLAAAAKLHPTSAAIPQWQFEAAMVDDDPAAAARALVRARQLGADPTAVALARARLLEARGRGGAALCVLARARGRQRPSDDRLTVALARANPSASPSSRSSPESGRGDDQDGTLSNQPNSR